MAAKRLSYVAVHRQTKKVAVDLHGFNDVTAPFALKYALRHKHETEGLVGGDGKVIFICGKGEKGQLLGIVEKALGEMGAKTERMDESGCIGADISELRFC